MADRIPLIVNPTANQIQEFNASSDTLIGMGNIVSTGGTFGNIQIAVTGNNIIDTSSGDITLDAAGNDIKIHSDCQLLVQNNTNSTSKTTGALVVTGGVGIDDALFVGGDITAYASSDKRLKDNITPIPNAVDKVLSISGNTFNWNEASPYEGKAEVGVIAQEVEKLDLPGVTETRDDGYKAVRYEKHIPLLIEAIKELKAEVDELKSHSH